MPFTQPRSLPQPSPWLPYPHRVLQGALAPGTAFTNGTPVSEVIPLGNSRFTTLRILTATGGGSLALAYVRSVPTNDPPFLTSTTGSQSNELNPTLLTSYTTGNPSAVTVAAGTEQILQATNNGEWYALVTFTPTASGTITWVDLALL